MRREKKVIRLTESEMINLVERIVNEVKREKRAQVTESLRRRESKRLSENRKRRMYESDDEIEGDTSLDVELEGVDENDPDPTKIQRILDKVENFLKNSVDGDLPKNLQKFKRKIKNLFNKHGKSMHGKLKTQCSKW
jgi:uncharacterized membrane-anchored protein YjiN (DUF445 family)